MNEVYGGRDVKEMQERSPVQWIIVDETLDYILGAHPCHHHGQPGYDTIARTADHHGSESKIP